MASPCKARKTSSLTREPGESGGVEEENVTSLDEARIYIRELKEKCRSQSQQILAWRRKWRTQCDEVARTEAARAEQLKILSSQLLLFEARLLRKQKDIDSLLGQRDIVIARQQQAIQLLQSRLTEAGVEYPLTDIDSPLDSLNDSDSAVVLEDETLATRSGIARSISDALEPCGKYGSRRSNGLLRRPEVLETVYSVEEDGDPSESAPAASSTPVPAPPPLSAKRASWTSSRTPALYGSMERLDEPPPHLTTYNRVMSNHRSVTKPKDVKYKRINKAKSKSLEELRGRLKNWVDKGHRGGILAFEHSEA